MAAFCGFSICSDHHTTKHHGAIVTSIGTVGRLGDHDSRVYRSNCVWWYVDELKTRIGDNTPEHPWIFVSMLHAPTFTNYPSAMMFSLLTCNIL
jgi:hypothetical protein